jgi:uncharacterized membrane protein YkoI
MKRTIAVFTLVGALGVTPALLAAPETKKTEAQETKKVEAQEMKKAETQADLQKEAKISMDRATEIALKRVPGKIKSSELEREHGKLIYSFDITTKKGVTEVNVDAITGKIVGTQHESAAKEAAEKKQESQEKKH